MRTKHLAMLLWLLTAGVANAQPSREVKADYHAVHSIRQNLPINIPEATELSEKDRKSLECLAWDIYFEARGGTLPEKMAVAWVAINRTHHPEFSNDICTNVFQYGWAGGQRHYQFSWAGTVINPGWKREDVAWKVVQKIAYAVLTNNAVDPSNGAVYFHYWKLSPAWARHEKYRIGSHVFWYA